MKYVAFFRNLNLGRKNCPDKTQFESAFLEAGAGIAHSFLTNGTIIFSADSKSHAQKIMMAACSIMEKSCGLNEPAYVRSLKYLEQLVQQNPFAGIDRENVYEVCVTFLDPMAKTKVDLPLESKRKDVEIVDFTAAEVLSVSRQIGKSPGSPNLFLEKLLGLPATTRAWNTIVRIVGKYQE